MKNKIFLLAIFIVILSTVAYSETTYRTSSGVDISLSLLNQDPDPVSPSSYVDVRVKLENYGNTALQNTYVKIIPNPPLSIEESDQGEKSIGTLQRNQVGNEGVIVKFRLKVDSNAVEGDVPIKIAYKSGVDGTWVEKEGFTVSVESSDKLLSIDEYSIVPERLKSGQTGTIEILLNNLASADIKDVKVKLVTNTNILPVENTNQKVIKSISKGNTENVNFNVIVSSATESGVYAIPLQISYKDYKENSFTLNNTISVIVDNTPELIVNIDESEIKTSNTKGKVTISISNSGVSGVKFVNYKILETAEYDVLSNPQLYIGNINSDDFETVDSEIFVKDVKEQVKLKIRISYKDSFNKDYLEEYELPLTIYTQEQLVQYGFSPKQSNTNLFIILSVVAVILIFWLFQFIDFIKSKMPRYKKVLWFLLFLTGIGALFYVFFGKSRNVQQS